MMKSKNHMMKSAVSVFFFFAIFSSANAQVNHPYPRVGTFHFVRGEVPYPWHARMDMININKTDPAIPRGIKEINPNAVCFSTSGWTVWNGNNPIMTDPDYDMPEEWLLKNSSGEKILQPGNKPMVNLSDLCPKVNGRRYNEVLPEVLIRRVDLRYWDGIATDWLWDKPRGADGDIDLDNNGKNDYTESGKGEKWVIAEWQKGFETLLENLRAQMPDDKYMLINSGLLHKIGWKSSNGLILENLRGIRGWDGFLRDYLKFSREARAPHFFFFDVIPSNRDPYTSMNGDSKNYYRHLRMMLTTAMLGDGYFSYSDHAAGPSHHYDKYYDEYDVNVGYPTSDAVELPNRCWARFFDGGVSIVNPTGSTRTLRDEQLRGFAAYNGPYYRFLGGQDPAFNNGQEFHEVELFGEKLASDRDLLVGDGIILLTEKKTIVSDIVIDSQGAETSPGSDKAELIGGWSHTNDEDKSWSMRQADHNKLYAIAYASAGGGEARAKYKPTINIPGEYEIFEWHGTVRGRQMATNTPYKLFINGQQKTSGTIDQSRNSGRWNSLGKFDLPTGSRTVIELTNNANGTIVADAIMLVFQEGDIDWNPDFAPSAPTGVRVETGR